MLENLFKNKRFFVTGATGFKGSWLSLLLHELGAQVTGYSIDIPTVPSLFEEAEVGRAILDIRGDIRDYPRLTRSLAEAQPEFLIHMAAQPLVRRSFLEPIETFSVNALGTATVLEAARHVPSLKGMVVVTTDKVYELTHSAEPRVETDRLGGEDPYSASKACAEIITRSYFDSFLKAAKLPVCTVRAGNVIGGGDWAQNRILPDLARAARNKSTLRVRSPRSVRPWQHVLEPVLGYLLTLTKLVRGDIPSGESFNFGPPPEAHVNVARLLEIAKIYFPETQLSIDETGSEAAGEMLELRLDWQKAQRQLGWRPLFSLEDSVGWTCEWYRDSVTPQKATEKTLEQIRRYIDKANPLFS